MILENTVDPWSRLHQDPARVATLMGNRGVIHDAERRIKSKTWANKRWICCAKSFKGIDRRPLFRTAPFSYSELFFLDEATAYASGHRPCNHCRKQSLSLFKQLWSEAFALPSLSVDAIDDQLHRERVKLPRAKATYSSPLKALPPGAMFAFSEQAFLVNRDGVRLWTSSGYKPASAPPVEVVDVLTPPSIVRLLGRGLPVEVHPSADA